MQPLDYTIKKAAFKLCGELETGEQRSCRGDFTPAVSLKVKVKRRPLSPLRGRIVLRCLNPFRSYEAHVIQGMSGNLVHTLVEINSHGLNSIDSP